MFLRVAGLHWIAGFAKLGSSQSDSKSPATIRKELTMSDFFTFVQEIYDTVVGFLSGVWGAGVGGGQGIIDAFTGLSS